MKIGVRLKIDVTKLDKEKFFVGKKGTYADLTTFITVDEQDQYGNNGFIKQDAEKGVEMPILGNSQVFWSDNQGGVPNNPQRGQEPPRNTGNQREYQDDTEDD